jgi:hypothetical protein
MNINDNAQRINTLYSNNIIGIVDRIRRSGGVITHWIVCGGDPESSVIVHDDDLAPYERANNVGCVYRISPVIPSGYDINGYTVATTVSNNKENTNA